MGEFLIIRCLVSSSVSIDDMGVHLPGKGSTVTVLMSSAVASSDLRARIASRQVSLIPVGPAPSRVWPLRQQPTFSLPPLPEPTPPSVPPSSPPSQPPGPQSPDVLLVLNDIRDMLGSLLRRPSPPPPEVVAAHVRALVPPSSPPGPSGDPHPQFIPSAILPPDPEAGSDIKFKSSDSSVSVDESVSALKSIRKNR